jgi:hypothetical protein
LARCYGSALTSAEVAVATIRKFKRVAAVHITNAALTVRRHRLAASGHGGQMRAGRLFLLAVNQRGPSLTWVCRRQSGAVQFEQYGVPALAAGVRLGASTVLPCRAIISKIVNEGPEAEQIHRRAAPVRRTSM